MDKFERIGFVIGMGLIVLGLITLFDGATGHSNLRSSSGEFRLMSDSKDLNHVGPELPEYDIILVNSKSSLEGDLEQSLSGQQEEMIRLALRNSSAETSCDLQGKRPDRVLWGQRGNQKYLDSLSLFSDEKMIYLGSYLEAWKTHASGGVVTCYTLSDQAAKLLTEL